MEITLPYNTFPNGLYIMMPPYLLHILETNTSVQKEQKLLNPMVTFSWTYNLILQMPNILQQLFLKQLLSCQAYTFCAHNDNLMLPTLTPDYEVLF